LEPPLKGVAPAPNLQWNYSRFLTILQPLKPNAATSKDEQADRRNRATSWGGQNCPLGFPRPRRYKGYWTDGYTAVSTED